MRAVFQWSLRSRTLELGKRTLIMGIVNVTPDSFSDGGLHFDSEKAVEHALRLGYLVPGDQLPRVRDVVAELAINPNTVAKAYKELETKGLTVGRPGQGTFIEATLSQVALPELTGLRRSLVSWVASADAAGLDDDGIGALVANVLRDFRERRGGTADRLGAAGAALDL